MDRPNPYILDVLYRAGAFPFDDFSLADGGVASVWVIPKTPGLPLVLTIRGNGVSTVALVKELHRLASAYEIHHGAPPIEKDADGTTLHWHLQVEIQCTGTVSRVLGRQVVSRTPSEVALMNDAWMFVSWFTPYSDPRYASCYPKSGREFDAKFLPPMVDERETKTPDDVEYEWESLPAPDVGLEFELPLPPEIDEEEELEELEEHSVNPLERLIEALGEEEEEDEEYEEDALETYTIERDGRRWAVLGPDGLPIDDQRHLKRDAQKIANSNNLELLSQSGGDDPGD